MIFNMQSIPTDTQKMPRHLRSLMLATTLVAMATGYTSQAQPEGGWTNRFRIYPAQPLEKSATRGIVTRDPSSVVQCKDEYWVFYTGRGVPSYHSKDLVKWEHGPAVFK